MAERNTPGKNLLEFGKATMYVISERGLQTEPLVNSKTADDELVLDKTVFSGKKVSFSRTKAIDFSWKEVVNASDQDTKIRILDLNGFSFDDNMKTHVCSGKIRPLAGATSQHEHLNRPYMCFDASRFDDIKQVVSEDKPRVSRLSRTCHDSVDGFKNCTKQDHPEKKTRREAETFIQEWFLEKKRLPYSHYVDSQPREQTYGNSKDQVTNFTSAKPQAENSDHLHGDSISKKREMAAGKCYLKRIFYPKGNNYSKPSNPSCLPQIPKSENHFAINSAGKDAKGDSPNTETTQRDAQGSNKLLPLNINALKNSEKQKHHYKSIVKLPTVIDKSTGQVHLSLEAVAFEQSDYNKWSRKQKRVRPENAKISCISFPLIAKSIR